jgi:DNA-binding transcriptional ArsR family regulator
MAWQNSPPAFGEGLGRRRGKVEIGLYSMMPRMFFGSGAASGLGCSAALVFLALCEHANRNNSNTFRVSDRALASDTGLGPRTIFVARKRLAERGLISCSRQEGRSFFYTLPVFSFDWIRLEDRPRQKRKARAYYA